MQLKKLLKMPKLEMRSKLRLKNLRLLQPEKKLRQRLPQSKLKNKESNQRRQLLRLKKKD